MYVSPLKLVICKHALVGQPFNYLDFSVVVILRLEIETSFWRSSFDVLPKYIYMLASPQEITRNKKIKKGFD